MQEWRLKVMIPMRLALWTLRYFGDGGEGRRHRLWASVCRFRWVILFLNPTFSLFLSVAFNVAEFSFGYRVRMTDGDGDADVLEVSREGEGKT